MMKRIIIFLVYCFFLRALSTTSKIVGLVPVRNEELIIPNCLKALAKYADAIVVLDDASDDHTVQVVKSLAQECKVAHIIEKKIWHRDEPGDRNKLLQAGRAIGGTHFIIVDADEAFTANCMINDVLRQRILQLLPGDKLCIRFIQLWRSTDMYRKDDSIWSHIQGDFVFCDDGVCSYSSDFIHTPRSPNNLKGSIYFFELSNTHGLMHFQFVNWNNLLIKQAWYRCIEKIRNPSCSVEKINEVYGESKDEKGIQLHACPDYWFKGYHFFDKSIYMKVESWQKKQVLQWFRDYGRGYFKELDIWDVQWD